MRPLTSLEKVFYPQKGSERIPAPYVKFKLNVISIKGNNFNSLQKKHRNCNDEYETLRYTFESV